VTLPTDEQILITREFDAPRHLVYKSYTTPELVKRWWSGKHGEFLEIEPDERIVQTEIFEGTPDGDSPPAMNTVTFTETGCRTTLTLLTEVPSREIRDIIIESGMEGGMQEGMDLLEAVAISLR